MIRKCVTCGCEFEATGTAKYCSQQCRGAKTKVLGHENEEYGELKIIECYMQNRKLYAKCLCSCGKICEKNYYNMRDGQIKSCGHKLREIKDLTGKKNDSGIIALRYAGRKQKNKHKVLWECQCHCGKIFTVEASSFSKVRSCGCKTKELFSANLKKTIDKYNVEGTNVMFLVGNQKLQSNNKSGITGVHWLKSRQRWRAIINFKKKRYLLGEFKNLEDAAKVRKKAEEKLHDNFLDWYAANYPEEWKKINKKGEQTE